jgi:tripartite-type tricarboxylate transporter receptor subunit TctC
MNTLLGQLVFAFVTVCLTTANVNAANQYPYKPVRLILPGPPGGGADLLARVLGQRLTTDLGQPFVIDYRPGAGGDAVHGSRCEIDTGRLHHCYGK